MSPRRYLAILILLSACTGTSDARPGTTLTSCDRPAARSYPTGDTTIISDAGPFPCGIEYAESGIELRIDSINKLTDIWTVARDSRGRFYTTDGHGQVAVWSPEGKVIRSLGRAGSGPGDFSKSTLWLFTDSQDNLYVREIQNHRWSIYSPEYDLLRIGSEFGHGLYREATVVAAPFTVLTSDFDLDQIGRAEQSSYFRTYDLATTTAPAGKKKVIGFPLTRSFGDVAPKERQQISRSVIRLLTTPVNNQFWAGPPVESGHGYELQLWGMDGTLKRTIFRKVDWFKAGADTVIKGEESPPEGEPDRPMGRPRPPTRIHTLRYDGHGLLYVGINVTNEQWDSTIPWQNDSATRVMYEKAIDLYTEIIDVDAGVVLASIGPISAKDASEKLFFNWLNGWSGYSRAEDASGLPVVKVREVRLVKK